MTTTSWNMKTLPTNTEWYQFVDEDASITLLEKQIGRTSVKSIAKALDEYMRLFKAGFASKGEKLTLHRAFPENEEFQKACADFEHDDVIVVGGPASVEVIDREGHMITTKALDEAFDNYMGNFRTRNAMVLHSDVQVGWALPAYITKSGQIFKSGVDEKGLFFITELRDDTKIAKRVADQVHDGKLRSYSIAGSATATQNIEKGLMKVLQVDAMELAEVTICEKGVNQEASFDIIKAENSATHSCVDGSCLIPIEKEHGKAFLLPPDDAGLRDATPPEMEANINCGSCHYYTGGACSVVAGDIADHQWCKLYKTHEEGKPDQFDRNEGPKKVLEITLMANENGDIDFKKSFDSWMKINKEWGTDEVQIEGYHGLVKASKKQPYSKEYKEKYGHTEKLLKGVNKTDPRYKVDAISGEAFTTLLNVAGREAEHHQLLREYGFPSEQSPEGMRYTPVVEIETDDFGHPINNKPPWQVNEAGEHLGNRLDEDSPEFKHSEKNASRKKNPSISITKSFLEWVTKEDT